MFHNHLVVDTTLTLFEFGTSSFVKLRHEMWMAAFREAAAQGQSLVFTLTPGPSVPTGLVSQLQDVVDRLGGRMVFVRLLVGREEQARRLVLPSRTAFGKLKSVEVLRQIWEVEESDEDPLRADLTIDTEAVYPEEAARRIAEALKASGLFFEEPGRFDPVDGSV